MEVGNVQTGRFGDPASHVSLQGWGGFPPLPQGWEAARPSQLPSQPARPPPPPHYGCAPEFGTGQAPTNAGMAHRGVVKMLALSVALALGTAGWV